MDQVLEQEVVEVVELPFEMLDMVGGGLSQGTSL
jgi:hypothetical protein